MGQDFTNHTVAAARAVGTPQFHAALLDLVADLVPGDNAQVMAYPRQGAPRYLATHDTTHDSQQLYLERYYRFDPYYRLMRHTADFGVRRDSEIRPRGYDEGGYYSRFFPLTGVDDYLGLNLPGADAGHLGIFIGRKHGFAAAEPRRLAALLPALLRLGHAHHRSDAAGGTVPPLALHADGTALFENAAWKALRASGTLDFARLIDGNPSLPRLLETGSGRLYAEPCGAGLDLLLFVPMPARATHSLSARFFDTGFLAGRLTRREADILHLILAGHDNSGIAQRLGILEGTIRNHRKRLYRKLGIHAERDLFSLLLAHIAQTGV
jgi:DNA-binding CsgD family transcriptional regulator